MKKIRARMSMTMTVIRTNTDLSSSDIPALGTLTGRSWSQGVKVRLELKKSQPANKHLQEMNKDQFPPLPSRGDHHCQLV